MSRLPTSRLVDANLPLDVEHADDTDFNSSSSLFLDDIEHIVPAYLRLWQSGLSPSMRPKRSGRVFADRVDEEWRMTRKLGSLLGEAEGVTRRMQPASIAFRKAVDCVLGEYVYSYDHMRPS